MISIWSLSYKTNYTCDVMGILLRQSKKTQNKWQNNYFAVCCFYFVSGFAKFLFQFNLTECKFYSKVKVLKKRRRIRDISGFASVFYENTENKH